MWLILELGNTWSVLNQQKDEDNIEPIRADFHIHTKFSPDSRFKITDLIKACLRENLNLIAVTDHHTIEGAQQIQNEAPFPVIIGQEILSSDGEIIGLFLERVIQSNLSAKDTVKAIKDQGGFVQIPHPFDRFRNNHINQKALFEILNDVDIIEIFNARTIMTKDINKSIQFYNNNKEEFNLHKVGVTDSHTNYEIGKTYNELPVYNGKETFLDSLNHSKVVGKKITPLIHAVTRYNTWSKKLIPS